MSVRRNEAIIASRLGPFPPSTTRMRSALNVRILVLEGITERGAEILRSEGWTVDMEKALPPAELVERVAPYHAILIRSGSQMNAQVIDAAKSLRVIGRAGVGVDNVDLLAATRRGVLVMNSPGGQLRRDSRAGGGADAGRLAKYRARGRFDEGGHVGPQVLRGRRAVRQAARGDRLRSHRPRGGCPLPRLRNGGAGLRPLRGARGGRSGSRHAADARGAAPDLRLPHAAHDADARRRAT